MGYTIRFVQDVVTSPKPFVFVLMPFDQRFDDIYKFGIKGAVQDVGAYAERVDEQSFGEGILDRIFNQISKADVVIADMTGRNVNVFYEVGYAHALGKIVLLLTQTVDDIPFDLKQRQHIVYEGKIDKLRRELVPKLEWAFAELARRGRTPDALRYSLKFGYAALQRAESAGSGVGIGARVGSLVFPMPLQIRNDSAETLPAITHIYLFGTRSSPIVPTDRPDETEFMRMFHQRGALFSTSSLESYSAAREDATDGLDRQFRLPLSFPPIPPGAVEGTILYMKMLKPTPQHVCTAEWRLRLHLLTRYDDYPFEMSIVYDPAEKAK